MKRREFLEKTIKTGLAIPAAMSIGNLSPLFAAAMPGAPYDLVAIKGGDPVAMFDKGIAALGGMKAFVKKNQTVVVKPNIGWDTAPERAADTNPLLVARIVKQCLSAGAKEVFVFDNTCDQWSKCYKNSGIERAVKDAGGKIVPGNTESYYHSVECPGGKNLKKAKVHELILSSDVFINVPILKDHGSSRLSISMKNLMGIVWDREYWHRNDLNQCIADFATWRKPTLNIVDAYAVMKKNGPRGVSVDDVTIMKSMIISADMVAADAAAAKLTGIDPDKVGYIRIAAEMNAGVKDLNKLNINRISM